MKCVYARAARSFSKAIADEMLFLGMKKLCEWIAAEAVLQICVERLGEHGASCKHRCCGVHPIGARSFDGCVECFTEREQFMVEFYDDRALYIAAIEAALRLPLDAPAL